MRTKRKFLSNETGLPDSVAKLFKLYAEEMNDTDGVLRRRLPDSIITVKAEESGGEDKPMIIEGIANYAKLDRWDEIIVPEAWNKYLARYMTNPIFLRQHIHMLPIGIATKLEIKDTGLYYIATIGDPGLAKLTPMQIETRSLLAQKILRTNSVGFIPHIIEWDDDEEIIRHRECELIEISVVSVPMQPDSGITSVKSLWRKAMSAGATPVKETQPETNDEAKAMNKECLDTIKTVAAGVKTLVDAQTAENAKNLALIAELQAKNAELTKELETLKKDADELVAEMAKQGLTLD